MNFISATRSAAKNCCASTPGHYHPTESIADKISSVLQFLPEILLHVSRGVRWDSDHVVILNDDLLAIAQEIVANDFLKRVHIGLDYFDASINRVAAWTIGTRNMIRALLIGLLETPLDPHRRGGGRFHLAPRVAGRSQDRCPSARSGIIIAKAKRAPVGEGWLAEVKNYEKEVLSKRR